MRISNNLCEQVKEAETKEEMKQSPEKSVHEEEDFGMLLLSLRKRVMQKQILAHLPGWSKHSYSRLEMGDNTPAFDQLRAIYRAFLLAGVSISLDDQQQFLRLARKKIESKKTRRDDHSDEEWAELCSDLTRLDQQFGSLERQLATVQRLSPLLLAETSHLLGREAWRENFKHFLRGKDRKKIVVVSGPSGIGKSSELNWLAAHLLLRNTHRPILCDFRTAEQLSGAEDALDLLLGTVLSDLGAAQLQNLPLSLDERITLMLEQIEKVVLPVVVLLDHAEIILREHGTLAPCWERFLKRCLRQQHRATFVLATNQWPGWFAGESSFLTQVPLPPLEREQGIQLLQKLGLELVPLSLLDQVYERVKGIPLCLEWVAALVKRPLILQDWDDFTRYGSANNDKAAEITHTIERLLTEPHIFAGTLADDTAPILNRIITSQRLTAEARTLLNTLALATIPLARSALEVLCPVGPRPIQELRYASVLASYPDRVQALPTVASAIVRSLSAEERHRYEERLIEAYLSWVRNSVFYNSEKGSVVAELAALLIKHYNLLLAAQLLVRYGWLTFQQGHTTRLAQLAEQTMQTLDWKASPELECGGLLLYYTLSHYCGRSIDRRLRHLDYLRMYELVLNGSVTLKFGKGMNIVHRLMLDAMNERRFEEALALFDEYCERVVPKQHISIGLQTLLLKKRAWLLEEWSEWLEEQEDNQKAKELQDQAIDLYQQCISLISCSEEQPYSTLGESSQKRRLAAIYNNLAYLLNKIGNYEQALICIDQCIHLEEQGYVAVAERASSYGEKSQILAGLGRFREALCFDEKALAEVQHFAGIGYTLSQEEQWIYHVNRGRLYLRLGRIEEAERLLEEAIPHIQPTRRVYQMFAHKALEEIRQWRLTTTSTHHQLDWRWIGRYRQLITYDAYWWWAQAGPFTEEEQRQWDDLYMSDMDEDGKIQLGKLIAQSLQRETEKAHAEQREPHICYPALDIEAIRSRLISLQELDDEISKNEPHPTVRRLYHGAIEYETTYLRLLASTYEKYDERFWELTQILDPIPTAEEMAYPLSQVRRTILKGLLLPETEETSRALISLIQDNLHLSLDFSCNEEEKRELQHELSVDRTQRQPKISAQAAKRFFETILQESGYEGWQVVLDPKSSARIEPAARILYLPDRSLTLERVKHLLAHELAGHVSRSVAGERSLLGILAIGTKNHMPTEEGFALYNEYKTIRPQGQNPDDSADWLGMLAVGLASGVMTPPQTFLSLSAFLKQLFILRRLLKNPQREKEKVEQQAQKNAITRCLRTYQGVPDLRKAGICYTYDAGYLRGLRMVEEAVARDEQTLSYLGVGKIALEQIDDISELGMAPPPQPLLKLISNPDLDSFVLSFEET